MQPLKQAVDDARNVALGEATHGSREFFQLKHRMLEFLATQMGFTIFAIEANMPAQRLRAPRRRQEAPFQRLHQDAGRLIRLRRPLVPRRPSHQQPSLPRSGVAAPNGTTDRKKYEFKLDVPADTIDISFGVLLSGEGTAWFDNISIDLGGVGYEDNSALAFLKPNAYQQGAYELRLDNQTQRDGHPTLTIHRTGQPANAMDPKDGVAAWKKVVAHMELAREKYGANPDTDWAIQNARVVLQCMQGRAEEVYRDESMAANIRWILDQNPGAKMVVWAHNLHVNFGGRSDRYAFAPMGEWLHQAYADEMVSFGFAFNQGSFQAKDQGKDLGDFTVGPAPPDGVDAMLASTRIPLFALDLRKLPKKGPVAEWFAQPRPSRSIHRRPQKLNCGAGLQAGRLYSRKYSTAFSSTASLPARKSAAVGFTTIFG